MNRDFEQMLRALFDAGADFKVIGAHAVAVNARPRATGDLDKAVVRLELKQELLVGAWFTGLEQ